MGRKGGQTEREKATLTSFGEFATVSPGARFTPSTKTPLACILLHIEK
jgi:hypothetical protein